MYTEKLIQANKLDHPEWLESVDYETFGGSHAYGVARPDSDRDLIGFVVPPAEIVFPHTSGFVGFGKKPGAFDQFQVQHVWAELEGIPGRLEYDATIYSIVKYFQLVANGNPNMIDSLFTSYSDVIDLSRVGAMVKGARHMFLSQKIYHTFRGMAFSHLYNDKRPYHVVRMVLEAEQLLMTGDLDLKASAETLKQVRGGLWLPREVEEFFEKKQAELEEVYTSGKSPLPKSPDWEELNILLLACLEERYGSLAKYGVKV